MSAAAAEPRVPAPKTRQSIRLDEVRRLADVRAQELGYENAPGIARRRRHKSAAHRESYEVGSDSDRLNSTQGDADSAGQTRFVERSPRRVGLPGIFI